MINRIESKKNEYYNVYLGTIEELSKRSYEEEKNAVDEKRLNFSSLSI